MHNVCLYQSYTIIKDINAVSEILQQIEISWAFHIIKESNLDPLVYRKESNSDS